jgi:hypothetical protein
MGSEHVWFFEGGFWETEKAGHADQESACAGSD